MNAADPQNGVLGATKSPGGRTSSTLRAAADKTPRGDSSDGSCPVGWTVEAMHWENLTPLERAQRAAKFQSSGWFRRWRLSALAASIASWDDLIVQVRARLEAGTATPADLERALTYRAELVQTRREVAAHLATMTRLRDPALKRMRREGIRERARWKP